MEQVQQQMNNQYLYLSCELDRLNNKVQRVQEDCEQLKLFHHEPEKQQNLNYDIISQSRSIAMIEDKFNQLSIQFDKLKYQLDEKVCLTDFAEYTSKIASEYATLSVLDLSISQIENRVMAPAMNSSMKSSLVNSKARQMTKQIQVYEYQHSIEQQVEERLNRFRELIVSQVRQFCDSIQAQDISKPFREQISNNVQNLHEKLHNVELFQMELQRHLEAREFEKLIKKYVEVEDRVKLIEANNVGLQNMLKTMADQKKQKYQEKQQQKKQFQQLQTKEDIISRFVEKEDFTKFQKIIEDSYLTHFEGAKLLQRINEIEDNITSQFNKKIYDSLQNEILDLDGKFGCIITKLQQDLFSTIHETNQKMELLAISFSSSISKSEIIQMLDNPQSMMKVNSAVQNIQEKFKELYTRQIEILEASFKYSISNIQAATITDNDRINQQKSLLKKCDNIKISLQEYFGQPISQLQQQRRQNQNQQQSQQFTEQKQLESTKKSRPLSVGSRKPRLKIQSATPKVISQSFSGSSVEPQFFQRIVQNPLVQKLKK